MCTFKIEEDVYDCSSAVTSVRIIKGKNQPFLCAEIFLNKYTFDSDDYWANQGLERPKLEQNVTKVHINTYGGEYDVLFTQLLNPSSDVYQMVCYNSMYMMKESKLSSIIKPITWAGTTAIYNRTKDFTLKYGEDISTAVSLNAMDLSNKNPASLLTQGRQSSPPPVQTFSHGLEIINPSRNYSSLVGITLDRGSTVGKFRVLVPIYNIDGVSSLPTVVSNYGEISISNVKEDVVYASIVFTYVGAVTSQYSSLYYSNGNKVFEYEVPDGNTMKTQRGRVSGILKCEGVDFVFGYSSAMFKWICSEFGGYTEENINIVEGYTYSDVEGNKFTESQLDSISANKTYADSVVLFTPDESCYSAVNAISASTNRYYFFTDKAHLVPYVPENPNIKSLVINYDDDEQGYSMYKVDEEDVSTRIPLVSDIVYDDQGSTYVITSQTAQSIDKEITISETDVANEKKGKDIITKLAPVSNAKEDEILYNIALNTLVRNYKAKDSLSFTVAENEDNAQFTYIAYMDKSGDLPIPSEQYVGKYFVKAGKLNDSKIYKCVLNQDTYSWSSITPVSGDTIEVTSAYKTYFFQYTTKWEKYVPYLSIPRNIMFDEATNCESLVDNRSGKTLSNVPLSTTMLYWPDCITIYQFGEPFLQDTEETISALTQKVNHSVTSSTINNAINNSPSTLLGISANNTPVDSEEYTGVIIQKNPSTGVASIDGLLEGEKQVSISSDGTLGSGLIKYTSDRTSLEQEAGYAVIMDKEGFTTRSWEKYDTTDPEFVNSDGEWKVQCKVGTDGAITAGAGSVKLDSEGMATYKDGDVQCKITTDGQFIAGTEDNGAILDANGLKVVGDNNSIEIGDYKLDNTGLSYDDKPIIDTSTGYVALDVDAAKIRGELTSATISADNISAGEIGADVIYGGTISADNITSGTIGADVIYGGTVDAENINAGTLKSGVVYTGDLTADQIKSGTIGADVIYGGTIDADHINAGTFNSGVVYAGDIDAEQITSGVINSARITSDSIASGLITSEKIASGTIESSNIKSGAIVSDKIASNAITTAKIDANAITSAKIASGAITTEKVDAGAITSAKIASNTITASNIASGTITATELASNSVTADKLNANAVTADKIASNAVTTAKINAGAITSAKIASGTIEAGNIKSNAITTDKINAGAVTTAKIATGAITADQIAVDAITASKISAGAVTADKIGTGTISTATMTVADQGSIIVGDLASGRVGLTQNGLVAYSPKPTGSTTGGAVTAVISKTGKVSLGGDGKQTVSVESGAIKFYKAGATIATDGVVSGTMTAYIDDEGVHGLGNNTVTTASIANNAVTSAKIASLSANKITTGVLGVNQELKLEASSSRLLAGKVTSGTTTYYRVALDGDGFHTYNLVNGAVTPVCSVDNYGNITGITVSADKIVGGTLKSVTYENVDSNNNTALKIDTDGTIYSVYDSYITPTSYAFNPPIYGDKIPHLVIGPAGINLFGYSEYGRTGNNRIDFNHIFNNSFGSRDWETFASITSSHQTYRNETQHTFQIWADTSRISTSSEIKSNSVVSINSTSMDKSSVSIISQGGLGDDAGTAILSLSAQYGGSVDPLNMPIASIVCRSEKINDNTSTAEVNITGTVRIANKQLNPQTAILVDSDGASTFPGTVTAPNFSGTISAQNASVITSGTFDAARIPGLGASKITSGTFDAARIPNLAASKITSGTLAVARIPDLSSTYATVGKLTDGSVTKVGTATVGGTTTPIYLNEGVPTALGYTIEKSVPSNAIFTDTNTKVTQTVTSDNNTYPILFTNTKDRTSNETTTARFASALKINASKQNFVKATNYTSWYQGAGGSQGGYAWLNYTGTYGAYFPFMNYKTTNGHIHICGYQGKLYAQYFTKANADTTGNNPDATAILMDESGNASWSGTVTATGGFIGNVTGNATTATGLSAIIANDKLPVRLQETNSAQPCDVGDNNAKANGFHHVTSSNNISNPFSRYHPSSVDYMVLSNRHSANWGSQIATDFRTNKLAVRNQNSGTWNQWAQIESSADWGSVETDNPSTTSPASPWRRLFSCSYATMNTWATWVLDFDIWDGWYTGAMNARYHVQLTSNGTANAVNSAEITCVYYYGSSTLKWDNVKLVYNNTTKVAEVWAYINGKQSQYVFKKNISSARSGFFEDTWVVSTTSATALPSTGYTAVDPTIMALNGNAATATNVAWSGVTGKPTSFTPASHNHDGRYWQVDTAELGSGYTMNAADFRAGMPIRRHVNTFANGTAPEGGTGAGVGDYYLWSDHQDTATTYDTIFCFSPRLGKNAGDKTRIFVGHFWNNAWLGWKELATTDELTNGTVSKVGTATVGGTTTPIYLNAGVPTALGYTIEKSVPANAVFTDTHNIANLYAGTSSGSANATTANGNTKLILKDGSSVSSIIGISGKDGVYVDSDASGNISVRKRWYATCTTAKGTVAKVGTCAGFTLTTGLIVFVNFSNPNTATNPTLNINGTGAKLIHYQGVPLPANTMTVGGVYVFKYNGTVYELQGPAQNHYVTTYDVSNETGSAGYTGNGQLIPYSKFGGTNLDSATPDGSIFRITMNDDRWGWIQTYTISFTYGRQPIVFGVSAHEVAINGTPYLFAYTIQRQTNGVEAYNRVCPISSQGNTNWRYAADYPKLIKIEKLVWDMEV